MTISPLEDIAGSGMLLIPIWLDAHHDEPDARFASAITRAVGTHARTLQNLRGVLEPKGLLQVEGEPRAGRGSRVTFTLTRSGRQLARGLRRVDDLLRGKPLEVAPGMLVVDRTQHPLVELERAKAWSLLMHLAKAPEDERFTRAATRAIGASLAQVLQLRDSFLAMGVLEVEGISSGGRGARLTMTLTPLGENVAREAGKIERLLKPG